MTHFESFNIHFKIQNYIEKQTNKWVPWKNLIDNYMMPAWQVSGIAPEIVPEFVPKLVPQFDPKLPIIPKILLRQQPS